MTFQRHAAVAAVTGFLVAAGLTAHAEEPRVTVALDGASLVEVAGALTRATGVKHRAEGVEAATRKFALFCREATGAATRRAVGKASGWEWRTRERDGVREYILPKPLSLTAVEQRLRARDLAAYLAAIQEGARVARDPKGKLDPNSAIGFQLTSDDYRFLFRALSFLPANAWGVLAAGRPLTGAPKAWPPEFADVVTAGLRGPNSPRDSWPRPADSLSLVLARDSTGRPLSLDFTHSRGKLVYHRRHLAPMSLLARDEERPAAPSPERLREVLEREPRLHQRLSAMKNPEWPKPPEEPTFVGWQLRDVHRRSNWPLVAMVYPEMEATTQPISFNKRPFDPPKIAGRTLWQTLNQIGDYTRYDWDLVDGWVVLQYRDWFWEAARRPEPAKTRPRRSAPPPTAPVSRWRAPPGVSFSSAASARLEAARLSRASQRDL